MSVLTRDAKSTSLNLSWNSAFRFINTWWMEFCGCYCWFLRGWDSWSASILIFLYFFLHTCFRKKKSKIERHLVYNSVCNCAELCHKDTHQNGKMYFTSTYPGLCIEWCYTALLGWMPTCHICNHDCVHVAELTCTALKKDRRRPYTLPWLSSHLHHDKCL